MSERQYVVSLVKKAAWTRPAAFRRVLTQVPGNGLEPLTCGL
jgi:hypothetical protein